MGASEMNELEYHALYREFRTEVFPRLVKGPRVMRPSVMKLWESFGLVVAEDSDRTSRSVYLLTTRGAAVRGLQQFKDAIHAHAEEEARLRAALVAELGYSA
jgi:hypothetical protein